MEEDKKEQKTEENNEDSQQPEESKPEAQPDTSAEAEESPESKNDADNPEDNISEEPEEEMDLSNIKTAQGPLGEAPVKQVEESPVPEELSEDKDISNENQPEPEEESKEEPGKKTEDEGGEDSSGPKIFAIRTTANREDQVMDFITSNIEKKKELEVYSVIRPHGMRGYIFVEAAKRGDAEQAALNIPYARGVLPKPVDYSEMEHMLEQVKHEVDIRKNDIAEIIAGPFKREQCKVTRVDKTKEEVVVELLEAAVPIPITVKMDAIKVIRREGQEEGEE
ncbi:transcription elongation factor Spt5 [Candidatus Woesearchaeota archaeon]|nr:transcription elongation factor Spt5 [Candidatus Woesearchaeota archaeon]